MIRIMVVDDHPIVRSGVTGLLETEPDFQVVGEAASGEAALELIYAATPDIVLMDLRMPGMGGVEATRRIVAGAGAGAVGSGTRGAAAGTEESGAPVSAAALPVEGARKAPRVLVFTTYEDDDQILAAIEAGASGYLVKAGPAEELAAGIRAVAAGQTVLAPSIAAQLVARAVGSGAGGSGSGANAAPVLTPRETQILGLVAEGLSNPAIAARLFIGESTVKTHLLHVFEKLGVSDRTRAVMRAIELRLLPEPPRASRS